jgi:hypothetical protein
MSATILFGIKLRRVGGFRRAGPEGALPKGAFKGAQAGRLCSFWGEASLGRAATIFPRSHERLTECSDDWDC